MLVQFHNLFPINRFEIGLNLNCFHSESGSEFIVLQWDKTKKPIKYSFNSAEKIISNQNKEIWKKIELKEMILLGLIISLYGSASSLFLNSYKLQINIQNRYVVSLGSMEHLSNIQGVATPGFKYTETPGVANVWLIRSATLIRCEQPWKFV